MPFYVNDDIVGTNVKNIHQTNLVGWWDAAFYDSAHDGQSAFNDLSGHGNHFTFGGGANYEFTQDGIDFDGSNDYAYTGGSPSPISGEDFEDEFSCVIWARGDASSTGTSFMMYKTNNYAMGFDGLNGGSNQARFLLDSDGTTSWTTSADIAHGGSTAGVWYMWTLTWDGSNINRYKDDGASLGARSTTGYMDTAGDGNAVYIGAKNTTDSEWNGQIAVIRMYKDALTQDEIGVIFNAYRSRFNK